MTNDTYIKVSDFTLKVYETEARIFAKGDILKAKEQCAAELTNLMDETLGTDGVKCISPIRKLEGRVGFARHIIAGSWKSDNGAEVTIRHDKEKEDTSPTMEIIITRRGSYKTDEREFSPEFAYSASYAISRTGPKNDEIIKLSFNTRSNRSRDKLTLVFHLTGKEAGTITRVPGNAVQSADLNEAVLVFPWLSKRELVKVKIKDKVWTDVVSRLKAEILEGNKTE